MARHSTSSSIFAQRRFLPHARPHTRGQRRILHTHKTRNSNATTNIRSESWKIRGHEHCSLGCPQSLSVSYQRRKPLIAIRYLSEMFLSRYFLGSQDRKPGQRHLYVVRDPTTDDPRKFEAQCITCDLGDVLWSSRHYYTNCTHFTASVNPRLPQHYIQGVKPPRGYYVLECEGPGLPLAAVHLSSTHRLRRLLYDTRPQRTDRLLALALPKQRMMEVPLPHGARAQVQMLLPPSWREELRDAAYPVLVEV